MNEQWDYTALAWKEDIYLTGIEGEGEDGINCLSIGVSSYFMNKIENCDILTEVS